LSTNQSEYINSEHVGDGDSQTQLMYYITDRLKSKSQPMH